MPPFGKTPGSRVGQRQVSCFVAPETLAAIKDMAGSRRETLQQALARGINAELGRRGVAPLLTCERRRHFIRVEKAAKDRQGERVTNARKGRRLIAGWFDRGEVSRLNDLADAIGISIQNIASVGLASLLSDDPSASMDTPGHGDEAGSDSVAGLP